MSQQPANFWNWLWTHVYEWDYPHAAAHHHLIHMEMHWQRTALPGSVDWLAVWCFHCLRSSTWNFQPTVHCGAGVWDMRVGFSIDMHLCEAWLHMNWCMARAMQALFASMGSPSLVLCVGRTRVMPVGGAWFFWEKWKHRTALCASMVTTSCWPSLCAELQQVGRVTWGSMWVSRMPHGSSKRGLVVELSPPNGPKNQLAPASASHKEPFKVQPSTMRKVRPCVRKQEKKLEKMQSWLEWWHGTNSRVQLKLLVQLLLQKLLQLKLRCQRRSPRSQSWMALQSQLWQVILLLLFCPQFFQMQLEVRSQRLQGWVQQPVYTMMSQMIMNPRKPERQNRNAKELNVCQLNTPTWSEVSRWPMMSFTPWTNMMLICRLRMSLMLQTHGGMKIKWRLIRCLWNCGVIIQLMTCHHNLRRGWMIWLTKSRLNVWRAWE